MSGLVIEKCQVPLAERAASGILPAQPHRRAFEHERAEGQRLSECPVDGPTFRDRLFASFHEHAQFRVQVEVFRKGRQRVRDALHGLLIHGGARAKILDLPIGNGAQLLQFVALGMLLRGIESLVEPGRHALADLAGLVFGDHALAQQAIGV